MSRGRPWMRVGLGGALLIIVLGTSGCVYWRLARVRGQLAEFPRFFTVEAAPGPTITFLKPVLRSGDIAWLVDLPPSGAGAEGDESERTWTLRKRTAPHAESADRYPIDIRVILKRDRIHSVALPERFNTVINQETLEKSFLDSDQGTVDRASQRTGWALVSDLGIPDEAEVGEVLGQPGACTETTSHRVLDYAYDVVRDGLEPGEGEPDATARFVFSRGHGKMVRADARLGALSVRVRSREGRDYRVTIQRSGAS